jgi:hypothetical protein
VQLYRYFVSQSSEFCSHNPLCCFTTSVYCCCLFRYRLSPETFGYTLVHFTVEDIPRFILLAFRIGHLVTIYYSQNFVTLFFRTINLIKTSEVKVVYFRNTKGKWWNASFAVKRRKRINSDWSLHLSRNNNDLALISNFTEPSQGIRDRQRGKILSDTSNFKHEHRAFVETEGTF